MYPVFQFFYGDSSRGRQAVPLNPQPPTQMQQQPNQPLGKLHQSTPQHPVDELQKLRVERDELKMKLQQLEMGIPSLIQQCVENELKKKDTYDVQNPQICASTSYNLHPRNNHIKMNNNKNNRGRGTYWKRKTVGGRRDWQSNYRADRGNWKRSQRGNTRHFPQFLKMASSDYDIPPPPTPTPQYDVEIETLTEDQQQFMHHTEEGFETGGEKGDANPPERSSDTITSSNDSAQIIDGNRDHPNVDVLSNNIETATATDQSNSSSSIDIEINVENSNQSSNSDRTKKLDEDSPSLRNSKKSKVLIEMAKEESASEVFETPQWNFKRTSRGRPKKGRGKGGRAAGK